MIECTENSNGFCFYNKDRYIADCMMSDKPFYCQVEFESQTDRVVKIEVARVSIKMNN